MSKLECEYAGHRVKDEKLRISFAVKSKTWMKFAFVDVPLEELRTLEMIRELRDAPADDAPPWDLEEPLPGM